MQKLKVVCPHCLQVNALPFKEHYAKALCGQCKNSLLSTKPAEVDETGFNTHLANNDIVVIADFWAPWCGPCKMMTPAFESAAAAFALKARFIKINTQEQQELGARFNIRSIPTLVAFKGNKELQRVSGALSTEQLKEFVSQFI
jgi:thioredoxin 2